MNAILYRSAILRRSKDSKGYDLSFSSELPVRRFDEDEKVEYEEVLSHEPEDVDMSRAKDGLPLLENHDRTRHVGRVENIGVDSATRMMRGTARFSHGSKDVEEDVADGIKPDVSVGYQYAGEKSRETKDGKQVRCYRWMPYEASVVSIPEDTRVGFGRAKTGSRAMEHQGKALSEAIVALMAVIPSLQAGKCLTNCQVAITAIESATSDFTPGTAEVAWEECFEAVYSLRNNTDELSKAAAAACSAAAEVCYQVWAGSNRSFDPAKKEKHQRMRLLFAPDAAPAGGGTAAPVVAAPAVSTVNVTEVQNADRTRAKKIREACDQMCRAMPEQADRFRSMQTKAVEDGTSFEDFSSALVPAAAQGRQASALTYQAAGISDAEARRYSLVRAARHCIENHTNVPDGLEGEVHKEYYNRCKGLRDQAGFLMPFDLPCHAGPDRREFSHLAQRMGIQGMTRDMQVNIFGQGGAFVPTTLLTTPIELLRNRMVAKRLGVASMAGLEGNVAIPRQTAAATAYAVSEIAALTLSNQAIDQISLSPKRVGAYNIYSKQLLIQSSVDVENFMRDDLMKQVAIKHDYLILQGSGANSEPLGIMNQPGIGAISFNGTATWLEAVTFETLISSGNADVKDMAFITTPSVRGKWKTIPKTGTSNQFPIFLWEGGDWADEWNDGEVNGYRAAVSNQVLNNAVAFGNWADSGHAMWGALDVVVDPYSLSPNAEVRIAVNTWADVYIRHAASFVWSTDAGNQ